MKDKLDRRRQELRTEEAILSALPADTDLGIIVVALAELLAENARFLTKGSRVAGGASDPQLLQGAAVLLAEANVLMGSIVRKVAWDPEWEELASDWNSRFAGWHARHAALRGAGEESDA